MLCAGWELVCVGGDNMYDDIQAGQTILILISLICFYFTTFCVLLEHFTVSIKNYNLGSNHKDFNTEDRPKLISQKSSWFIIPYDWGCSWIVHWNAWWGMPLNVCSMIAPGLLYVWGFSTFALRSCQQTVSQPLFNTVWLTGQFTVNSKVNDVIEMGVVR